jgi:hypothetical protein
MSSKEEITSVLHEIEIFGSLSGLVLNRNKTQGMWVGKFKKCKDKMQELAMNVSFGKISDFIISIFPIMVRFLFSQDINNFFI